MARILTLYSREKLTTIFSKPNSLCYESHYHYRGIVDEPAIYDRILQCIKMSWPLGKLVDILYDCVSLADSRIVVDTAGGTYLVRCAVD